VSQGMIIKGKTAADQPVPIKVDDEGKVYIVSDSTVDQPLTDDQLRAAPIDVNVATTIYKKLIDDTSTPNVTYIGEALPGTAPGTAAWRIKKVDESSGVSITWAGLNFDVEWDDRVTETYA